MFRNRLGRISFFVIFLFFFLLVLTGGVCMLRHADQIVLLILTYFPLSYRNKYVVYLKKLLMALQPSGEEIFEIHM